MSADKNRIKPAFHLAKSKSFMATMQSRL